MLRAAAMRLASAPTEFPSSPLHRERSASLPTSGLLATWPTRRWRRCDQLHHQAASLNLHSERYSCITISLEFWSGPRTSRSSCLTSRASIADHPQKTHI
ncbi:hypothetical protein VPH35_001725 [Triticum aestivum]